jgi:hypothetical protein
VARSLRMISAQTCSGSSRSRSAMSAAGAGDRRGGVVPVAGRVVVQVCGALAEQLQRGPEVADRVAWDRDTQP